MSFDFLLPISQAVATFAGAVFVIVGIWYKEKLETARMSRNAKVQIFAEMRALLDLIELNGYLPALLDYIEDIKQGSRKHFFFPTSRSFSSVYEGNLQNLGLRNEDASDVVRFYMIINSAVEDKDSIAVMARQIKDLEDQRQAVDPAITSRMLKFHELLYAKLSSAVQIGQKLIQKADSENYGNRQKRRRNRQSAGTELDNVEKALDTGLASVEKIDPATSIR